MNICIGHLLDQRTRSVELFLEPDAGTEVAYDRADAGVLGNARRLRDRSDEPFSFIAKMRSVDTVHFCHNFSEVFNFRIWRSVCMHIAESGRKAEGAFFHGGAKNLLEHRKFFYGEIAKVASNERPANRRMAHKRSEIDADTAPFERIKKFCHTMPTDIHPIHIGPFSN